MEPKLSVCFGTMNRRPYLEKALVSCRQTVGPLPYEIIVVCGPSNDGSIEFLRDESARSTDLIVLEQTERTGAVKAFNLAFRHARGVYVAAFNDDAEYLGNELERAAQLLDVRPEVGQVAIPFRLPTEDAHLGFVNLWGMKLLYANFSVIRRELGNRLGWWGENHFQYAGDTELSIKVWNANYRVAPLIGGRIMHHQVDDATRVVNTESKSLSKWNKTPPPAIIQQLRQSTAKLPTSRNRRPVVITPRKPNRSSRKGLPGVEGMTMVRYYGERGLQVKGTVSGIVYRFGSGSCVYVDDRDLVEVFAAARTGDTLRVV